MRIIIIGTGEVGQHIAKTLSDEHHDVTVVERDEARVEALQNQLDALVVAGNGASPKFLHDIDAGGADLLLAVTEVDEVNVLAAASGHRLGVERTLARVRDADYFGSDASFVRDVLGIDLLIDPERATAHDLADTLLVPGAVHVEYFAEGRIALAEAVLTERSPLIGVVVGERERARPHSIIAVLREGHATIPAAHETLAVGDHVLVAAAREDIGAVIAHNEGGAERIGDVVVFGGGKIGVHLAQRLEEHGLEVKLMERDPERARWLAERLPDSLVLQEEDVSREALLTHGVDRAGAFVACAGDDRTNLLAAMHAKRLGTRLCFAVVSREEYVPLVDALGIDAAFSLRLTTAEAILRFVRASSVRAMHLMLTGSEVLDLHADPDSPIVGCHTDSDGLLAGCEVGAILRDERVVIPDESTHVEAGDRVLVFRLAGAPGEVADAFDA